MSSHVCGPIPAGLSVLSLLLSKSSSVSLQTLKGQEVSVGLSNPQLTFAVDDKSMGPGRGGGHCQGYQEGHSKPAYFLSLSAGGSHKNRPSGRPLGLESALLGLKVVGSVQRHSFEPGRAGWVPAAWQQLHCHQ